MFQLWSWDLKNEDPFARCFSSKSKKYIDFSVCNFRVLSFHLKHLAVSQAQNHRNILEACFIALITGYQNILIHPSPERDGSRKINGPIRCRNVSRGDKSFNGVIFTTKGW